MDRYILERRLSDLPLGGIRFFERIGSTNDEAAAWANAGAPDASLVIADEQTRGRGRGARQWFTYPGSALAFSLILRPSASEAGAGTGLSRFTGLGALGVCLALQKTCDLPAQIKWPNDVLIHRKKVCGILAEAQWIGDQLSAVIVGIGINVAPSSLPPGEALRYPATCIEDALGRVVDRPELLHDVLTETLAWRNQMMTPAFLHHWEKNLAFRNEKVLIVSTSIVSTSIVSTDPDGETEPRYQQGTILGLGSNGELELRTVSGSVLTFRSGEIPPQGSEIHLRPVDN